MNTTDVPRTRDVTLLGIDVQIRAVPTRFTWTFGDGTAPLVTGDPGSEWTPAHGTPTWTDIPGEAETTTPGPAWQALEMRSVLVDGTGE